MLLATGAHPRYVPPGFIVYTVAGSLHAVAFDLDRLEVVGMPVPVVEGIQTRPSGAAGFAVAPDGTLAYLEGAAGQQQRSFVWIDRQGRETPVPLDPGDFDTFALSPDGGSVAVTRRGTAGTDASIWVWSHERQTLSRLTFEPGVHEMPLWAPDGRSIVYTTCRSGCALHIRRADGTGVPEPLQRMDDASERTQVTATGWTRDGRVLFEELRHGGNWDVKSVAVTGTREESVLLSEAAYREGAATVSPDGRWIAYVSNESGFPQVYVRTFPNLDGGKWQVSADFATTPRWSPDGRTLYFLDNPQQGGSRGVAAVTVPAGDTFSVSKPERLFDLPASVRGVALVRNFGNEFEVSPDGQQFLFMKDGARAAPGALHVVLNWTTELARLARAR